MEKHTCKLCYRSFANGRALGGHMRSHVTSGGAKPQAVVVKDSSSSSPSPSFSSTSSRDEENDDDEAKAAMLSGLGYGLRSNPKKSFRLVDPEFSSTFAAVDAGSSVVVQDRESETESSRAPTHRRRSKRARPAPEPEPVSSVSDTTPEEEVARSLMRLSRDFWVPPIKTKSDFDDDDDDEEEGNQELEQEPPIAAAVAARPVKGRSKYQCGTCKKVFRSYQALGGHRASHKKIRGCVPPSPAGPSAGGGRTQIQEGESSEANAEKVVHECPVCFRVFSSGQALGGHKRSHLANSTTTITITSSPSILPPAAPPSSIAASPVTVTTRGGAKYGESLIDLNLPAPMEEDGELSAVSDAEFVLHRSTK